MKTFISLMGAVIFAAPAAAQTPKAPATATATQISGSVTAGVQPVDNSTNSSKLSEYRDLRETTFVPAFTVTTFNPGSRLALNASGNNLSRDDRALFVSVGQPRAWRVEGSWIGVPHNYSNKALTPYTQTSAGVFQAPATIPITFKKLATSTAADIPGVLASDDLVAAFQAAYLRPTALSTQTDQGHAGFTWSRSDALSVGVAYDLQRKKGLKPAFGPIGDRPPRTLNIQMTEPVDYRTNDLTFAAEHNGGAYQLRGEYQFSDFANQVDTLKWQNVYATPVGGATYDAWDRSVSAYGVRPLPPDNRYHNASLTAGIDLPSSGRLNATTGYGRLEQNQTLLPYSYNVDQIANKTLPRSTAEGSINTTNLALDYVASPASRLNLRAFFHRYGLNNETPSNQWQYVTSDTSNLNGTVSYVNKRVSLPYAWDRRNAGVEATWRLAPRQTATVGYEFEGIGREFREADTSEHSVRAAWRLRAAKWASLDARFTQGMRSGDGYNNVVTHEGYWYTQAEATDFNNPALSFDNHPDMRRFDVSDRSRRQVEFRASLTPRDIVAISAYARYRKDDFDSDVVSSQPLSGTGVADAGAATPGDQLGRLNDERTRFGLDAFVQPASRVTFNAFLSYDQGKAAERSMEFNENNKLNPGTIATAELGPWTRRGNQWTADFDDRTWNGGFGTTLQLVPDRLSMSADYTASLATVAVAYGGYGVVNFDGTPFPPNHQFAFSSPPDVREKLHVVNLRFEIPLRRAVLLAGYSYETYALSDWQQGSSAPWVEEVGADTLLRDTSRSFQWGNRLFNLGTYLAPSYDAHIGFLGLRFRF